ncbi:nitrite reductase [Luteococcus sp. OSA5]|uniref:nitrite reductase n=1 Tax=Luteococcus sp. OSA5 TaxID=3401630 RepID=UPI003B42FF90
MASAPAGTAGPAAVRTRPDRCPGILRPWPADDGLLVRLRLVAGNITVDALRGLVRVAQTFGDGRIHLTSRANLQLRGLPDDGTGQLAAPVRQAIAETGLLPAPAHDLVRNVMASPLTGIDGGRTDLTGLAHDLDQGIRASELLAGLPGKFLFVLDDGRGDLLGHWCDLGLVALDEHTAQLRVGDHWGPVVGLSRAVPELLVLAERFVAERGDGPEAAWHVDELAGPLADAHPADPRLPEPAEPLPFGAGDGWEHLAVGADGIDGEELLGLLAGQSRVRVTPWYGLVVGYGIVTWEGSRA